MINIHASHDEFIRKMDGMVDVGCATATSRIQDGDVAIRCFGLPERKLNDSPASKKKKEKKREKWLLHNL